MDVLSCARTFSSEDICVWGKKGGGGGGGEERRKKKKKRKKKKNKIKKIWSIKYKNKK